MIVAFKDNHLSSVSVEHLIDTIILRDRPQYEARNLVHFF